MEADPRNVLRLRRALELNSIQNATILPVAASDAPGQATLDGSDVFTHMSPGSAPPSGGRVVETVRLDAMLGPDARVDFCKIDVEGAEWQVLKGMTGLMDRGALPVVAFEFNGSLSAYGHGDTDFLAWLRDQGYKLATYDHDRRNLNFGAEFSAADHDLFAFTKAGLAMVAERMPEIQPRL